MKGVSWSSLLPTIVIILGLVVLGFFWIEEARGAFDIDKLTQIEKEGKEGITDYIPPQDPFDSSSEIHIITNPGDENQLHEVACVIANDIYTDYVNNGNEDGTRDDCNYMESQCLVSHGYFTLDDSTTIDPNWETKLSTSAYGPCHVCEENGIPINNLDEVCINLNLRDRRISGGSRWFCDDEMTVGGETAEFGNNDCDNLGNNDAWLNHCDGSDNDGWGSSGPDTSNLDHDFCDNGYDKMEWWPDSDGNIANTDPIWKARDNSYWEDNEPIAKHRKYAYGLWWREESSTISESDRRYDLVLSRIPEEEIQTDFSFIPEIIENRWERFNKNGHFSQGARMVANFLVKYECTEHVDCKNELDLRREIIEAADSVTDTTQDFEDDELIVDRSCNSETECLTSVYREKTECTTHTGSDLGAPNPRNSYHTDNVFHNEPIYLNIPIEENGDIPSGNYRVIITNWYGYYWTRDLSIFNKNCHDAVDRTIGIYKIGEELSATITIVGDGNVRVFVNGIVKEDIEGPTTENIDYLKEGDSLRLDAYPVDNFERWNNPELGDCTDPDACTSIQSILQDQAFSITYYFN